MSQEFISHDGADANGVRAEVVVIKGKGRITETTLGNKDKSIQVSFIEENLKLPIKAWANVGTPIHEAILKAKESGEELPYRIEIQRKSHIDRTLPMSEVRPQGDMLTANKNAIRILAQLGDVVSEEAVTHPSEDEAPSFGRYKATGNERPATTNSGAGASVNTDSLIETLKTVAGTPIAPEIQAVVVGTAIALGVNPDEALKVFAPEGTQERPQARNTFSQEGKAWEHWNSDGRENYGHARFTAGTGAESFVRQQLHKAGIDGPALEDGTVYFTNLVLSIADRVQVKLYGEGFRPDRAANSHTRIRGIVYDTIENYFPFPVTNAGSDPAQTVKTWIAEVGNQVFERLKIVIEASNAATSFSAPLPELIYGAVNPKASEPVEKTVTDSEPTVTAEPEPVKEPVKEETATPTEEPTAEPVAETVTEETPATVEEEPVTDEPVADLPLEIFEPVDIASLPEEVRSNLATEETIGYFRSLIEDAEIPDSQLKLVANLLRKTFGSEYSKAQQIPDETLTNFIDFYVNAGPENLRAVIQNS